MGNRESDKGCEKGGGRIAGERASVCTRVLVHEGGTRVRVRERSIEVREMFFALHSPSRPFAPPRPRAAVDGLVNVNVRLEPSRARMRSRNNFWRTRLLSGT